jgi:hypothetical protein
MALMTSLLSRTKRRCRGTRRTCTCIRWVGQVIQWNIEGCGGRQFGRRVWWWNLLGKRTVIRPKRKVGVVAKREIFSEERRSMEVTQVCVQWQALVLVGFCYQRATSLRRWIFCKWDRRWMELPQDRVWSQGVVLAVLNRRIIFTKTTKIHQTLFLSMLSPLCRVFSIIYLKQTTFLGHTVLQLFCIYSLCYM